MGRFNNEMISAGVLVAAEGLDDASQGVVVDYSSEPPVLTDEPYGETKELFGGFWILEVASKEEAVEWAKRAPMSGPGTKTEIRRVTRIDVPAGQRVDPEGAGMARGNRPVVSRPRSGRQAVEAVWRMESARIVGTLARFTGDFALAEDLAQEALAEALVAWPWDGVPRNPAGWLLTVGRRRAIDTFRRSSALDEALCRLAPSPIVELNRAVAISMAQGPAAALPVIDDLVAAGSLSGSDVLASVRGELLSRLRRTHEARREFELA